MDDESWFENQGVRDHGVVVRICVLLNVEILLHLAASIGKERPLGANSGSKVIHGKDVVGSDSDDSGITDDNLRVELHQLEMLLMVLWTEVAARQNENHRVQTLQIAQPPPYLRVICQLIVGKRSAR